VRKRDPERKRASFGGQKESWDKTMRVESTSGVEGKGGKKARRFGEKERSSVERLGQALGREATWTRGVCEIFGD